MIYLHTFTYRTIIYILIRISVYSIQYTLYCKTYIILLLIIAGFSGDRSYRRPAYEHHRY